MKKNDGHPDILVEKITQVRWEEAQQFELKFARSTMSAGDDWNVWWKRRFEDYRILKARSFETVLEVGCGPHTNLRLILPDISFQRLIVEDPLIDLYLNPPRRTGLAGLLRRRKETNLKKLVQQHGATTLREKLEEITLPGDSVDLCVCINVLDHVQDAAACIGQMKRILKSGGALVLGQDLSNEEDFRLCPESWTDIGHPIKLTEEILDRNLDGFHIQFRKILPRQEGRNPAAHYGTYLFIGEK